MDCVYERECGIKMANILYLTTRLPYPVIGGDKLRMYNILRQLKLQGHNITLVSLVTTGDDIDSAIQNNEFYNQLIQIKFNKKLAYFNAIKAVFNDKPVIVEYFYSKEIPAWILMEIVCGFFAVLGHVFPALMKFKGGKGVATSFAVLLALHWPTALIALGVFIVVVAISKYVSLSSISASVGAIASSFIFFKIDAFSIFCTVIGLLCIYRHKANIARLIAGTENKLGKKSQVAGRRCCPALM